MAYVTISPHITEKEDPALFRRLRAIGPGMRLKRGLALTDLMYREQLADVTEQHPTWSQREIMVHLAGLRYGEEVPGIEAKLRDHHGLAEYYGAECGELCRGIQEFVRSNK